MKNYEVWNLYTRLAALRECDKEFSPKVNDARFKNMRLLKPYADAYADAQNEIVKKYGESAGDGSYKINPEKLEEYSTELEELNGIENDITLVRFPADELNSINLRTAEYETLAELFED
ncbi:MAG: hypothetical protein NC223_05495 [Butyrivibrio sp.]|nr:hypothetical protein [Butyrivibrio sp.]